MDARQYKFEVGKSYQTQEGKVITIVRRNAKSKGYETIVDERGWHYYDRSTHSRDAGRLTGTKANYSDPRNIKRL